MFRFAMIAAVVSLILTAGLAAQENPKDKPKESAEQKAVRAYLKENLPTGKFEEIKWWGPKGLQNEDWDGWVAMRLKYRAENERGGMSVNDDVFMIRTKDKKVDWHRANAPLNINKERIFGK